MGEAINVMFALFHILPKFMQWSISDRKMVVVIKEINME